MSAINRPKQPHMPIPYLFTDQFAGEPIPRGRSP